MALEEGAPVTLLASALGPLRAIPGDGALGTQQRRLEFEQKGTVTTGGAAAG